MEIIKQEINKRVIKEMGDDLVSAIVLLNNAVVALIEARNPNRHQVRWDITGDDLFLDSFLKHREQELLVKKIIDNATPLLRKYQGLGVLSKPKIDVVAEENLRMAKEALKKIKEEAK